MAETALDLTRSEKIARFDTRKSEEERRERLMRLLQRVRARSTGLVAALSAEDKMIQSMPEASPVKWHLAHTTWLLEHLVLVGQCQGYTAFDDSYGYLFDGHQRRGGHHLSADQRGRLSRPSLDEVTRYRDHVNAAVVRLIRQVPGARLDAVERAVTIAVQHELRHQEHMLSDAKHALWSLPQQPALRDAPGGPSGNAMPQRWITQAGGLVEIGHEGPGFAFDDEGPRHRAWQDPYKFAGRLVTCGEYRDFVNDGGYEKPSLWLAEGWALAEREGWRAPLYWQKRHGEWAVFTLAGLRPLADAEPVCHVSFYEAAAFARWAGKRLPTGTEWELFAQDRPVEGNLLQNDRLHPVPASCAEEGPWQMFGDCWEWTVSSYAPYPRFKASHEGFAEWNGRFLSGLMVLRGGSCLTPAELMRPTFRQALAPQMRHCMTGIRLAQDA
ncbi:ergothioneine biosynthesis protein EgtB [Arenibaculum pallidiluteum]|uniref:ergothioneine biosynthesis protein EgtB n=1 Tax=Arenibaculum pallidiluteum TaxID=2812559 RepID=UPI001F16BB5C|nr:ergothioneine biosynthesis protein EgtB [Arenibaculum pallidiluteum]